MTTTSNYFDGRYSDDHADENWSAGWSADDAFEQELRLLGRDFDDDAGEPDDSERAMIAVDLVAELQKTNARFDVARFLKACNCGQVK